jgi:hypothetical protein
MRRIGMILAALSAAALSSAGCGSSDDGNGTEDVLAYVGIEVGKVWNYDVDIGLTLPQAGEVKVVGIDPAYVDGVEAYQVEIRQNANLIATRWYQVTQEGLFLLGQGIKDGADYVESTFVTAVKLIPYPIENANGTLVQNWSSQTDVEEGGNELHRFDNAGKESITVEAGSFEAFHLTHTRTVNGTDTTTLEEYFFPQTGYVQFEYPADATWTLK